MTGAAERSRASGQTLSRACRRRSGRGRHAEPGSSDQCPEVRSRSRGRAPCLPGGEARGPGSRWRAPASSVGSSAGARSGASGVIALRVPGPAHPVEGDFYAASDPMSRTCDDGDGSAGVAPRPCGSGHGVRSASGPLSGRAAWPVPRPTRAGCAAGRPGSEAARRRRRCRMPIHHVSTRADMPGSRIRATPNRIETGHRGPASSARDRDAGGGRAAMIGRGHRRPAPASARAKAQPAAAGTRRQRSPRRCRRRPSSRSRPQR